MKYLPREARQVAKIGLCLTLLGLIIGNAATFLNIFGWFLTLGLGGQALTDGVSAFKKLFLPNHRNDEQKRLNPADSTRRALL